MTPRVLLARDAAELESNLNTTINDEFRPGLAIVFASNNLIEPELMRSFHDRGIEVFGGASGEEIAGDRLVHGQITAMLLDIDPAHYRLRLFPEAQADLLGREVADWARGSFANPAVLLLVGGAGISLDVDDFLSGLFAAAPGLPVFGGLTSAVGYSEVPPLFSGAAVQSKGVYALAFDNDRIDLRGLAISGWREIGTPKRITRSKGNVVHEIEGEPAGDFYRRYFKIEPGSSGEILDISEYPLRLQREDGSKVMRTAIRINPRSKAVIFGGAIPEGALVRFCSPNIVETIKHTVEELQTFRREAEASVDGVILFDCAIRSRSFGSYMRKEIQVIQELWQAPLIGFSSWGEIGNGPGETCGFHNTVISTVLIRDKNKTAAPADRRTYSGDQVESFVDTADPNATIESLRTELTQLRKQKTMLSHFLHLTSDDLEAERRKSDELLLNILPAPVAERLKHGERNIADSSDQATILFADIVGFTELSAKMTARDLVKVLNRLFSSFDELAYKHGVEKIKTIGDAYMAVAGLPESRPDHAHIALKLGQGLLKIMELFNEKYAARLRIRVGLNSGPVVAGVIGKRKFSYDLWGDAVNVASRMESHGLSGRVHLSESTFRLLKDDHEFESRGTIEVKGKGPMNTYLYPAAKE